MGANKPIEDIDATLLAATKSALDETAYGCRSKSGETPDRAADPQVA
jgi:hypothetical protein